MIDWPSDVADRDAKRQAQINQHAFMAKLSTYNVPVLDQISRAGFVFRSTCEFAPWEKDHHPEIEEWYEDGDDEEWWRKKRDLELERVDRKILNAKVPVAAQWMQYVGERLYEMEGKLNSEYDWQNEAFNCKWAGDKGWSKERWVFWRRRFEWMTTVTALEKSTQRIARECAERMKKIEAEKGSDSAAVEKLTRSD